MDSSHAVKRVCKALALALPFLLKLVRSEANSKDNRLVVAGNPIDLSYLQDGLNILLCQAQSRCFAFLVHCYMIASCIFSVNVLYFLEYFENRIVLLGSKVSRFLG